MTTKPINPLIRLQEGDIFTISSIDKTLGKHFAVLLAFQDVLNQYEMDAPVPEEVVYKTFQMPIGEAIFRAFGKAYNLEDVLVEEGKSPYNLRLNIRNQTLIVKELPDSYKNHGVSINRALLEAGIEGRLN